MMTSDDFKFLAATLKEMRTMLDAGQWRYVCNTIAIKLKCQYPAFKRLTFLEACGIDSVDVYPWEPKNLPSSRN